MTVLNFVLQDDLVGIVTDSVVSDPVDMNPMLFTTKVYPVPHWQGVICGTGIMQVVAAWVLTANTSILARDIVHLDEFAPSALRELFARYTEQFGVEITATLYHFGYCRAERRFVGFAYRSTSQFRSERLRAGIGLKPAPEESTQTVHVGSFPEDLVTQAHRQKDADDAKPLSERVGIGGQLFSYLLRYHEGRTSFTIEKCGEFDDFERAYAVACRRLPANKG